MGKLDTFSHFSCGYTYIIYYGLKEFISPSQQLSESHNSLQIPFGVIKYYQS